MSEVTLQNLDKSLPLVLKYEQLVATINESIARGLGLVAIDADLDSVNKAVATNKEIISEHFDEEMCSLLGALTISRCHIIIEAENSDGLGPDHTFPWENAAQEAFGFIGGSHKLEVIRKPSIATVNVPSSNESALAA